MSPNFPPIAGTDDNVGIGANEGARSGVGWGWCHKALDDIVLSVHYKIELKACGTNLGNKDECTEQALQSCIIIYASSLHTIR